MKEINMTTAISCMPDKFITMEMVELALQWKWLNWPQPNTAPNLSTICQRNILLLKYLTAYLKLKNTDGAPGSFQGYLKKKGTARFVSRP